MRSAYFSKCADERLEKIKDFSGPVLLIHPKKTPRSVASGLAVAYEDVDKDSIWLNINSRVNDRWTLVLECPTRYPKITSKKVQFLQRLSRKMTSVHVVDIVPFTLGIEYLYTPFSYLGRDILGFPHWYAFRENYGELINGEVVDSLSPVALAPKIKPFSLFSYSQFSAQKLEVVATHTTENEKERYAKLKEKLFAEYNTPRPVITRLADYSHSVKSRTDAVAGIAKSGDVVFCNLQSYANKIQKKLPLGANAYSYAAPPETVEGRVIIAEPSIANDYQQLDAEALSDEVILIKSDLPVDSYLHGIIEKVRNEIDALAREI